MLLSTYGGHFLWLIPYVLIIAILYQYTALRHFSIPWLPLSLIGTAVTFYVGFKNNQAYDRLWEARTIWGGIVNSSRMWGSNIKALIYRQIAWLFQLRQQLLAPTPWEHLSLKGPYGKVARRRRQKLGLGLLGDDITDKQLQNYLTEKDYKVLPSYKNGAVQLIDLQSQELAKLRKTGHLGDFEHIALQGILNDFYEHQGKAERIKKTPFPRQFASFGFIMVCLFVSMLPFGFFSEFTKIGAYGIWLAILFTILIGWVYVVMELVGDYSENPFEGLTNDIPLLSISRNIEIDLLQQLGVTNLPEPIPTINHVLL